MFVVLHTVKIVHTSVLMTCSTSYCLRDILKDLWNVCTYVSECVHFSKSMNAHLSNTNNSIPVESYFIYELRNLCCLTTASLSDNDYCRMFLNLWDKSAKKATHGYITTVSTLNQKANHGCITTLCVSCNRKELLDQSPH